LVNAAHRGGFMRALRYLGLIKAEGEEALSARTLSQEGRG
jgi:hypothetical protein